MAFHRAYTSGVLFPLSTSQSARVANTAWYASAAFTVGNSDFAKINI